MVNVIYLNELEFKTFKEKIKEAVLKSNSMLQSLDEILDSAFSDHTPEHFGKRGYIVFSGESEEEVAKYEGHHYEDADAD